MGGVLQGFYIFGCEKLWNMTTSYFANQGHVWQCKKKVWMKCFLFKEFLSFFEIFVPSGMFLTSCHLLYLDEHGPHVIQKK
jgi:hypothetical protein